jgi:hypothetical protein
MRFLAPLAVLFLLAVAAPAQADITSSVITTPKNPRFLLYTARDTGIEVAGRATGIGNVDLVCVVGSSATVLAHDVQVGGDGKFWAPGTSLDPLIYEDPYAPGTTCRLRAVPAGTKPDQLTHFRGPVLAISRYVRVPLDSGPNAGKLAGYHLYAAGVDRDTDFGAFGAFGVNGVALDPVTLEQPDGDGYDAGTPADALAGLLIDGVTAYSSGAAASSPGGYGAGGLPGFAELPSPTVRFDDASGAVDVSERTPFMKCGPDVSYPPTQFTCTRFDAVPVQMQRTTSVLAGDQIVRVVDRWSSTDGHPHRLDLTLSHAACCSYDHEYRFPGETSFNTHGGDVVIGPFPAGSPILARHAGGAGSGLVYLPLQSADGARFLNHDDFGLVYNNRTIPASGALEFTHYYLTTRSAGDLDAAAAKLVALATAKPPAPEPTPKPSPKPAPKPSPVVRPAFTRAGHVRVHRSGRTFAVVTRDRVRCAAACTLAVHGRRVVSRTRSVAAGRTAKVSFRLTRAAARRLVRHGRLRFSVRIAARIGAGAPVSAKRTLTLRVKA